MLRARLKVRNCMYFGNRPLDVIAVMTVKKSCKDADVYIPSVTISIDNVDVMNPAAVYAGTTQII